MKHRMEKHDARKNDITIEEVKSLPTFADFSDEQALEVVRTIKIFVEIALDYYKKEQSNLD
ncbi:hypothetical protein [Sphingobacterium hungaricum]|uniref:hypothetical protein n=1 Tax=Sphingobacterium hungaricum TaxID=2082723 RepID=UPI0018C97107|nr:hypothetical protein [Sphingobacterium hungaricum]